MSPNSILLNGFSYFGMATVAAIILGCIAIRQRQITKGVLAVIGLALLTLVLGAMPALQALNVYPKACFFSKGETFTKVEETHRNWTTDVGFMLRRDDGMTMSFVQSQHDFKRQFADLRIGKQVSRQEILAMAAK